eukprot:1251057-Alexandrium_andersonii.AAC.1
MKAYIAKFKESIPSDSASLKSASTGGALGNGRVARTLGSAPPRSSYEDLAPLSVPKAEMEE